MAVFISGRSGLANGEPPSLPRPHSLRELRGKGLCQLFSTIHVGHAPCRKLKMMGGKERLFPRETAPSADATRTAHEGFSRSPVTAPCPWPGVVFRHVPDCRSHSTRENSLAAAQEKES